MKKKFIKDDNGDDYLIENIDEFKIHIFKYHSCNNQGDNSIHEEKGRFFTVSKEFYRPVENYYLCLYNQTSIGFDFPLTSIEGIFLKG